MWLCTNYGFFSAVKVNPMYANGGGDNAPDETYAVRARERKHLKEAFNNKTIYAYPYSDYEYRVYLTESELQKFLLDQVTKIDYTNFKNSVKDTKLHDFFNGIWYLGVKYLGSRHGSI